MDPEEATIAEAALVPELLPVPEEIPAPAAMEEAPAPEATVEPEPLVVAEPEPVKPNTYTVRSGDNLSEISNKIYGTSARWEDLRDANADVLEGGIDLQVGMTLVVPE